ncbi:MAG: DUF2321 domain-containing protein [Sphingopyxis terrae]|nr:DUF2321 domain-containing protein [Sphingopyxis terrae]
MITDYAQSQPEAKRAHCASCGAATIEACQTCGSKLRGYEHIPGVFYVGGGGEPDRNCPDCGQPHPWTKAKQDAVSEWVSVIGNLTDGMKEELRKALPDIYTNTAKSELAVFRIKALAREIEDDAREPFLRALKAAAAPQVADRL